jgi:hypothetical protein
MNRIAAVVGGVALLLTVGIGSVSAQPANDNIRTIAGADCEGQTVDLVTMNGAAAWDAATGRVFVLMGATRDGIAILPLVPGQADKDLSTCRYTNFGHLDVIYGMWVTSH